MPHMRAGIVLGVIIICLTSFGAEPASRPATKPAHPDETFGFLVNYRIEHYLESAAELQKLEPDPRMARLKALAVDPMHASKVYVLCRMLF